MFFDSGNQESYLIDRVSTAGRNLRRVLVISDESILICKLDGIVTRVINVGSISHLVFGAVNGIRAGIVLLRIPDEHDLLFTHPTGVQPNVARLAAALIEKLTSMRANTVGSNALVVVERNDEQLIRSAADVNRAGRARPVGFPVEDQILTPILFDDIPIVASDGVIADEIDLFVDSTFINMLLRSIDLHPITAHEHPRVIVECPAPFRSVEISARFFTCFCRAYDAELPLAVNVHSHLPSITSFRATKKFWVFVQRLLQVSRPITSAVKALASDHVEAYVVGEEQYGVSCTTKEWNDAIIQWEMKVRNPHLERNGKRSLTVPKDGDLFWQTFVSELEKVKA